MSIATPTPESLKEKAKVIRKFLSEKYNVDVSQGHGLEMVSQVFGFKDWNTAAAAVKDKKSQAELRMFVLTVGEMRRALEPFKDSAALSILGNSRIKAFIDTMKELELEQGVLTTEYSLTRSECSEDKVTFQLKCEDEYLISTEEVGVGSQVDWEEIKSIEKR